MSKEKSTKDSKKRIKMIIEEAVSQESSEPVADKVAENEVQTPKMVEQEEKVAEIETDPPSKNIFKLIIVAFFSMLFVAVVSGGIYTYLSGVSTTNQVVSASPTPTLPSPSPETTVGPETTQSPTASNDLSGYKIVVLNGSGKIGVASQTKADLLAGGFKSVSTNNADAFDFQETVVSVKENVPDSVKNFVKEILTKRYSVIDGENLPTTASFDVEVTLGLK